MTYLDTEELHTRLEELRDMRDDEDEPDLTDEEEEELNELEEIEGYCMDFKYGERMIPVDEFEEHARELYEEVYGGDLSEWPLNNINWVGAADDLKHDYTLVTYQGYEYYVR